MSALNVIYEQEDTRGIIKGTAIAALLIVGAIVIGIVGILAASALGFAQELAAELGSVAAMLVRIATWLGAALLCSATIAAMYRFAPDRADAEWRWLSVGSVLATIVWLIATLGFGFYASRFGDYNAPYGSQGAVVVLDRKLVVQGTGVSVRVVRGGRRINYKTKIHL